MFEKRLWKTDVSDILSKPAGCWSVFITFLYAPLEKVFFTKEALLSLTETWKNTLNQNEYGGLILIKCQCCPHIETSQLVCANQLTGIYMRATLALHGLIHTDLRALVTALMTIINPFRPNPRRREKINLKFLFLEFAVPEKVL